jgi:uncharacterized protein HemX
MDPATAILVASAVAAASKGAGDYFGNQQQTKQAKRRAKETKRETQAGLFQNALDRSAELEAHRLASSQKLGKRKATSFQDTSDLVRGALSI